jgi:hypothetical protein
LAIGTNTYLDYPRSARITNGLFSVWLAGGFYDADFVPYTLKPIRILVWPGDTNTYTFNQAATLAVNAAMFNGSNLTVSVTLLTNELAFVPQVGSDNLTNWAALTAADYSNTLAGAWAAADLSVSNSLYESIQVVAGSNGVVSFNERQGLVSLTSNDVVTALGFTPGTGSGSGQTNWDYTAITNAPWGLKTNAVQYIDDLSEWVVQITTGDPVLSVNVNTLIYDGSGGFQGVGTDLTLLNASNLGSGTVPLERLSGITSNELDAGTWLLATNTSIISGISSNQFDAPTKAQLALAGTGWGGGTATNLVISTGRFINTFKGFNSTGREVFRLDPDDAGVGRAYFGRIPLGTNYLSDFTVFASDIWLFGHAPAGTENTPGWMWHGYSGTNADFALYAYYADVFEPTLFFTLGRQINSCGITNEGPIFTTNLTAYGSVETALLCGPATNRLAPRTNATFYGVTQVRNNAQDNKLYISTAGKGAFLIGTNGAGLDSIRLHADSIVLAGEEADADGYWGWSFAGSTDHAMRVEGPDFYSEVILNTNRVAFLRSTVFDSTPAPPALTGAQGAIWNSNKVCYWVTATTNIPINLVIPESAVNTNWVYYPMTDGQTETGAHFTLTGLATAAGGWFPNANNLLAARLPGTANKAVFWNIPQSQMMAGTNVTLEAQFCTSNSFPFSVLARIVTLDFDTHTVDQGMLGGGITNVTPEGTNFWWFKTNFTIQSTNCLGTLVVGNRTEHTNVAYLTMVRMKITP